MLAFAGQGAVLVFFVAIYVAYLSFLAFVLSVVIVGMAAALFHAKSRELAAGTREAAEWENRLFDRLIDLLDGFKEVRLNRARSDDLYRRHRRSVAERRPTSRSAPRAKPSSGWCSRRARCFSCSVPSCLWFPTLSDTTGSSITKTTTALMFVVGVCFGLVQTIPVLYGRQCRSRQHRATGDEVAGDCRRG